MVSPATNGILIPALYALAGITAYAGLHHALIARRRPVDRTHLWFALLCATITVYVAAKTFAYQSDTAQALVELRRWEISFAILFFIVFPWFVREYTGLRPLRLPMGLSVFMAAVLMANLLLPYGVSFVEFPEFAKLTLPWGEQVADLRVHRRGDWHHAGVLGMLSVFGYSLYACRLQYRRGEHRQALMLVMGIAVFMAFFLFNQLVNRGIVEFTHTAEFGFLSLVFVMNRALEREARETDQRMRAVLDNVPAVVYLKDLQGRYLLINRQFERLFQVSNAAVASKTDYDLFPAAQADALRANDRLALDGQQSYQFEEEIDICGKVRNFLTLKFPIRYPDGEPYALCGVSTDVTESRKAAQEMDTLRQQVWHSDRVARLGAISTSLAHELNQPLTAILSNAQAGLRFIEQGGQELSEFQDILHDIVRDDKRAIGVIAGLRAMLRQKSAAHEQIALADTVTEVLDLVHGEIVGRGVECGRSMDGCCKVLADKVQIGQVVLNLIMNALDALDGRPEGQRHLHIAVASDGEGQVRVAVRDTGTGLPPNQLERIFDNFYSTKTQGLGIGLALCRSIIESHGGRIWANDNEDQGATVQFVLPIAMESHA